MTIAESLLPEFDHEMASTRKALERVPEDKLAWKPHERSMTLGRLASHVAELPGWASEMAGEDFFDVAPPDGQSKYRALNAGSRQEILDAFDAGVREARGRIAAIGDDAMGAPWSLKRGGETLFTQPRASVLRSWLLNHVIHHRGQLTVYLRLTGTPVPSIYGPSADESGM
jgi:uncharacterized damage-inducible protein DinB